MSLPGGWIECTLDDLLVELESGSRPKGGVKGILEGIPSLGGEHISDNGGFRFNKIKYIPSHFAEKMNKGKIQQDDILVVKDGATTGKVAHVDNDFPYDEAYVNEHVFICRPSTLISSRYLFRYLFSDNGQKSILNNFKGSAQGGINQTFAPNTHIHLAPFNEQQRIVAKLEAILAKVQSAQAHLESIPELLKRTRQTILCVAVSGKLTEEWRLENSVTTWKEGKLEEVIINKPKNGYSPRPVDYPTSVKALTLTATTSGKFDPSYFKFIDEEIPEDSPFWLNDGDILIQRGNTIEYVGVSAIYRGEPKEFIYPDLMMKVQANKNAITEFLHYCLLEETARSYFRNNATGTAGNMPKINQAVVMNTPINIPSVEEQQEIVRRVEAMFERLDRIETIYKKAKETVDNITQSTLAKAFRGELVPQDLNDEPASVLLERIQAGKATQSSKPKHPKVRIINVRDSLNLELTDEVLDMVERKAKDLLEVLQSQKKPMQPEDLLRQAGYSDDTESIEEFYKKLKQYVKEEKISENKRPDKKVLLSAGKK